MAELKFNAEMCRGCGICFRTCAFGAIQMENHKPAFDDSHCILCGSCANSCRFRAITFETGSHLTPRRHASISDGIWVFAEQWDGNIHESAAQLLSEANRLADIRKVPVTMVLFSADEPDSNEWAEYGADRIILVQDEKLRHPEEMQCAQLLCTLAEKHKPEIILFGATAFGRGMAPMAAAMLNTGLTADCTALDIDPTLDNLLQTRPAFGGNIMATIICRDRWPQMATVRPGVFRAEKRPGYRCGILREKYPDDIRSFQKITQIFEEHEQEIHLSSAKIVIAGGAGIGSSEGFEKLSELARLLGGACGASRGAVEMGIASPAQQVGQTGITVSPEIYIAAGISGAVQHTVGMDKAKTIIAINNDPEAPIFSIADYGIVGDAHKIIEEMIAQLKENYNEKEEIQT